MCTQIQLNRITDEVTRGAKGILGDKLRNIILYGSYARGDFNNESDIDTRLCHLQNPQTRMNTGFNATFCVNIL